jgi:hypothetical protein
VNGELVANAAPISCGPQGAPAGPDRRWCELERHNKTVESVTQNWRKPMQATALVPLTLKDAMAALKAAFSYDLDSDFGVARSGRNNHATNAGWTEVPQPAGGNLPTGFLLRGKGAYARRSGAALLITHYRASTTSGAVFLCVKEASSTTGS